MDRENFKKILRYSTFNFYSKKNSVFNFYAKKNSVFFYLKSFMIINNITTSLYINNFFSSSF